MTSHCVCEGSWGSFHQLSQPRDPCFFLSLLFCIGEQVIYSIAGFFSFLFQAYNNIDISVFFFGFSSCKGYYRVLSRVPCAIPWILVDYFINSSMYMLVSTGSFLPAHHLSLLLSEDQLWKKPCLFKCIWSAPYK